MKSINFIKTNKSTQYILLVIFGLIFLSLVVSIWLGFLPAFRIVFGSFYILFFPGLVLTFAFFKQIDIIERIALSFALSVAIVPLFAFYLNLIGIKLNLFNVSLEILFIIGLGLCLIWLKNRKGKN